MPEDIKQKKTLPDWWTKQTPTDTVAKKKTLPDWWTKSTSKIADVGEKVRKRKSIIPDYTDPKYQEPMSKLQQLKIDKPVTPVADATKPEFQSPYQLISEDVISKLADRKLSDIDYNELGTTPQEKRENFQELIKRKSGQEEQKPSQNVLDSLQTTKPEEPIKIPSPDPFDMGQEINVPKSYEVPEAYKDKQKKEPPKQPTSTNVFESLSDNLRKRMQMQGIKLGLPLKEEQSYFGDKGDIKREAQYSPYERQAKRLDSYLKEEIPKLEQLKTQEEYRQKVKEFDDLYKSVEDGLKRREVNLKKIEELRNKSSKGELTKLENQELIDLQRTEAMPVEGADISRLGHVLRSFYNVFPHQAGDFVKALGILKQYGQGNFELGIGLQQIGDLIKEKGSVATNPYYQEDFATNVLPQAFGSGIMFYGSGLVGRLAKLPTYLLPIMTAALPQATKGYEEAKESGADDDTALKSFFINMGIGSTEVLPVIGLFRRLDKKSGGLVTKLLNNKVNKFIKEGIEQGFEEVVQETAAQFAQNLTAKEILAYDIHKDLTEGMLEGGAAGLIVGFFMGSMGAKIHQMLESKDVSEADKNKLRDIQLGIDEIVRNVQKPNSDFAKSYYQQKEITDKLELPTKPAESIVDKPKSFFEPPKLEPQQGRSLEADATTLNNLATRLAYGDKNISAEEKELQNEYPNYLKALIDQVKETPEYKEWEIKKKRQAKEKLKTDNYNYTELSRQFRHAQRKRNEFDTTELRTAVENITTPEIREKADRLLSEAEQYNENLRKRNELTLENVSRRKYGTTDLNSLTEDQQKAVLNEYNEMKKQGITEFKQIRNVKPTNLKGEEDAVQEQIPAEIPIQPGTGSSEGIRTADTEVSLQEPAGEITEAEKEDFIKRPGEEEAEAIKPTDDLEVEPEPSEAQIEAGNYKKGHIKRDGLDISIENLKGSTRSGTDRTGKKWQVELQNAYGYIRGTTGKDKDHLDVFLADNYKEGSPVFVINQTTPEGKFDEHKVMLGFESMLQAEQAYISNYEEGKAYYSDIVEMTLDEFKEWSKDPKQTKKPAGEMPTEKEKVEKQVWEMSEEELEEFGSHIEPKRVKINVGDIVYHVAPPEYKRGQPIYSGKKYEDVTGNILPDKWSANISPTFNYKEYADFYRVSVYNTFEEAFAFNKDIYEGKGKILEIKVQRPPDGRNNEGYAYFKDEIPASWIRREMNRKIFIQQALAEGKPVPPEVLKDYPDLAKTVNPLRLRQR